MAAVCIWKVLEPHHASTKGQYQLLLPVCWSSGYMATCDWGKIYKFRGRPAALTSAYRMFFLSVSHQFCALTVTVFIAIITNYSWWRGVAWYWHAGRSTHDKERRNRKKMEKGTVCTHTLIPLLGVCVCIFGCMQVNGKSRWRLLRGKPFKGTASWNRDYLSLAAEWCNVAMTWFTIMVMESLDIYPMGLDQKYLEMKKHCPPIRHLKHWRDIPIKLSPVFLSSLVCCASCRPALFSPRGCFWPWPAVFIHLCRT